MSEASLSPPASEPAVFYDDLVQASGPLVMSPDGSASLPSPATSVITRTVAIIKTHALQQRLDIEPRLLEANFEVVKERPMEFDIETDPEALYELFGDDAQYLGEGPVWVYVLERRRAVQVLLSLVPSLNDVVIASKTDDQAEQQIAALFVSSPPFPLSELPPAEGEPAEFDRGSLHSVDSAVYEAIQLGLQAKLAATTSEGSSALRAPGFMNVCTTLSDRGSNSSSGKTSFRARPLPKTHLAPDITPRLTKAALLRQGLTADGVTRLTPSAKGMGTASTGRIPPPRKNKENEDAEKERAKEQARKTFVGVPGHKRAETICVASTAPPVIAPRLTKAAALRLGLERPATPPGKKRLSKSGLPSKNGAPPRNVHDAGKTTQSTPPVGGGSSPNEGDGEETETEGHKSKNIFEGVPGHKRRETISVPSTSRPPSIPARINRSAMLRKEGAPPPSSFMFRGPSVPQTPGSDVYSRSSSALSAYRDTGAGISARSRPSSTVPSRASSRVSNVAPALFSKTPSHSSQTSSSGTGTGPLSTSSATSPSDGQISDEDSVASPPSRRTTRRPSSLQAPIIVPRVNKSAMLRAQKQAADAAKAKSPYANAAKR
ncbi:hypothetical protein ID866_3119 [Astraeus odoratus]|nr:hypothetical protein ID866_3119 [Astraeus odoratus]